MFNSKFGIEIEFTGITRQQAARIATEHLGGRASGDTVTAPDGRQWKFTFDGSITCQRRVNGRRTSAGSDHSVELVSPILKYREDIDTLQELVRKLRQAGAFTYNKRGLHIHLDAASHPATSIRTLAHIIA